MTPTIETIPTPEELWSQYDEAHVAASEATRNAGKAVALALRCGRSFRAVRHFAGKDGDFRAIIREAIPELPDATIDRWIKMEERSGDLLSNPHALRQAFLSIGLLPEPEPVETSREEKPWWNYVAHLGRAERAIRDQVQDFETLTPWQKETLKKRLQPLVEIYGRLM